MTTRIDLPDKLDTAMAAGLAQRIAATGSASMILDGRRVQMLGALCAQIIAAAHRDAKTTGRDFRLLPSESMRDDLALLGLSALAAPDADCGDVS